MYDFGAKLRELRKSKNLTQQKLGEKLGLSEAMISKYESNFAFPQFDTLRTLSAVLNVSLDELCGIQSNGNVSLYGLNGEQIDIIINLIDMFRNKTGNLGRSISEQQYVILGKITEQFLK